MNLYSNSQSIEERVRSLIAWTFVIDEADVKDDTHFVKDLGADSMDLIELVISVNETFSVELDATHLESMLTTCGLIQTIKTAKETVTN
ncbi:acyl carrier protein [Paludibacterium paludis]|uniref:Acyl carrier protein n=1 Tax=Paludibacterium paludis TaxID=1225769 RepID=A0A918UBL1_9NEIS|nr:acyl carrier protein [Paludibacterium paludis]GGY23912.1 acyl carrier protein [Paludibacterium paludis]